MVEQEGTFTSSAPKRLDARLSKGYVFVESGEEKRMENVERDRTVCLIGDPAAVGRAFAEANGEHIGGEVAAFFAETGSRDALMEATAFFRSLVKRLAPHWLEEMGELAAVVGVDVEEYAAYQGAKYRGINRPECFTYFSAPEHNAGDFTLFHKNRDNRDRPQAAYCKGLEVAGKTIYRYVATGDTSDMGTMMGLNEKGLAVAADTGAEEPDPRFRGMMNPDLMRLILEGAADVDEAREMIGMFHREKVYAGGKVATNWMFADARGRGLRLYQFHESLEEIGDRDGLLAMREDERGKLVMETLEENCEEIGPALMNRLSRTEPVLHKSNISAMTAVVPAARVDLFGYAEFAVFNSGRTVYVPLYLGVNGTPKVLVDGTLYRLSKEGNRGIDERVEGFEAELGRERETCETRARGLLAEEGEEACRRELTAGCLRLATRVKGFLENSEER
jgi:hypothetical protein